MRTSSASFPLVSIVTALGALACNSSAFQPNQPSADGGIGDVDVGEASDGWPGLTDANSDGGKDGAPIVSGPSWPPAGVELLADWRADVGVTTTDGFISRVADQSGHKHDLVAPGSKPFFVPHALGDKPAIRFEFDGANRMFSHDVPRGVNTTVVFVARKKTGYISWGGLLSMGADVGLDLFFTTESEGKWGFTEGPQTFRSSYALDNATPCAVVIRNFNDVDLFTGDAAKETFTEGLKFSAVDAWVGHSGRADLFHLAIIPVALNEEDTRSVLHALAELWNIH